MKGKVLAIGLLLGFLLPPATNHLLYKIGRFRRFSHFTEHKASFTPEQLESIVVPDLVLIHWEKKGNEFILEGKLYDVLRIEKLSYGWLITCVHDQDEDMLVSTYTRWVDPLSEHSNALPKMPKVKNKICLHGPSPDGNDEIVYANIEIVFNGPVPASPVLEITIPPPEHFHDQFVG